ncbi:hypothetical protein ACFSTE_21970 [Aquimarina hainanensis]|uniref:PNPLA domain-containing protein n=2 Tax=Aquimarina hainanensis TaxID=1578017 RepID=A0ABW5NFD0_9FLAO
MKRTKLLLFFQQFSIWFKILLGELMNNLISLVLILAVYLTLWHFPQTIDLLLILNQADAFFLEIPLYFVLLTAAAFLIWNIPKYFYYHNYKDISLANLIGFIPNQHYRFQNRSGFASYSYIARVHMRKVVPRILGTLLLIISALSILHAMKLFGLENMYTSFLSPEVSLMISILFLLCLCEPRLYRRFQKMFLKLPRTDIVVLAVLIGLIVLMISLGSLNTQAEKDLGKLFLSNSALVLFFFLLSFNSYRFLKKFPNKKFYGAILAAGFLILLGFIVLNFIPDWASMINPLTVLILSLLSLFMISFILILIGKKIKLPLLSMSCFLCFLSTTFFTSSSTHYQLELKDTEVKRKPMEAYFYQWIQSREHLIQAHKEKFPVIIASAEGGGSRAGLWSFLVHSYLYEKTKGKYFEEHLLSLTGASGGSVGNAMFFATSKEASDEEKLATFKAQENMYGLKYKASQVYKKNYLSASILSFLGRDLFKMITSLFKFQNRGQLLEEQWKTSHRNYFSEEGIENSLLGQEFLSFYKDISSTIPAPPLLLINTTHTQSGNYNVISPVTYDHLRPLSGMNDFLGNLQYSYPDKSIALSTAMRINASFPYVTPVGEIKQLDEEGNEVYTDQYADAGYYDNIGGRVSKGVEEVFITVLQKSFPSLVDKIEIKHLVIAHNEKRKAMKKATQLSAPLTTLQNVRIGHTKEAMNKLGNSYAVTLTPQAIVPYIKKRSYGRHNESDERMITPVLPVGRYLSTIAIRSMEAALERVKPKLDTIL